MSPAPVTVEDIHSFAQHFPAYDFLGLIAQSDAGVIIKARQRSLEREVAIRISSTGSSCAKALAGLTHPNLIKVYDSNGIGGRSYLTMEFVPGKSLRHSARGTAIDPRQAAQIVIACAQGIAHAHQNGVVHGSLNPANILLGADCVPKIGNFGSMAAVQAEDTVYLAPELSGDPSLATIRSDVFALGVIFQELLTGVPVGGMVPDIRLASVCRKATHPNPAERYQSATELAGAVSRWLSPVKAPAASAAKRPAPFQTRKPALTVSGGHSGSALVRNCAVIAFLLFSVYALWGFYQAKHERITRLQKEENAKPKVIIVKQAGEETASLVSSDP